MEKIEVSKGVITYNRLVVKNNNIWQHVCSDSEHEMLISNHKTPGATNCDVCRLFGSTGENGNKNHPARILVRDAKLSNPNDLKLDALLIMEAKMENVLDRVHAAATPRTIERVPVGAKFNFEIVYRVEGEGCVTGIKNSDKTKVQTDVKNILLLLRAVEREGLGGNTSRGYGQVSFELTDFFYQKVKESGSTTQFPEENGVIFKGLEKVIEHVNDKEFKLQEL
jgi:CRISPR-associated protein Csm3